MNLHAPERQAHESQKQYRERQAASKAAIRVATKGPRQAPARSDLDTSRFFLGQHTNPAKAKRRALIAKHGRRQALRFLKTSRRLLADRVGA